MQSCIERPNARQVKHEPLWCGVLPPLWFWCELRKDRVGGATDGAEVVFVGAEEAGGLDRSEPST